MIVSTDAQTRTILVDSIHDVVPPLTSAVPAASLGDGWRAVVGGSVVDDQGRVFEVQREARGLPAWVEVSSFPGVVFGEWWRGFHEPQYVEVDDQASTTNTAFQTRASIALNVPAAGLWKIDASAEYTIGSSNRDIEVQLVVDAVVVAQATQRFATADRWLSFAATRLMNLSVGAHSILLQYRSVTSGQTAKIRRARIYAGRQP